MRCAPLPEWDDESIGIICRNKEIGKAFEQRGHEVFSVKWSKEFENIDLYDDINKVTAEDILKLFGKPDVICCIQPPLSGDLPADRRRPGNGLQGI